MQNDKRKGEQAIPENLRQVLTAAQAKTLDEITALGWQLKFVRRPLFQDPIPVVSNAKNDQIGVLDQDGKISIDTEFTIRAGSGRTDAPGSSAWSEKRNRLAPVPNNLVDILNEDQMTSLRQIENFGWQLHFVRRPLFQDPVVVIVSAEGDRFGTLEADGRIEIKNHFDIRNTSQAKSTDPATGPATGK
ncbi:MAG: hypothetical protein WBO37_02545 [Gammaproteobacteria bacterium]